MAYPDFEKSLSFLSGIGDLLPCKIDKDCEEKGLCREFNCPLVNVIVTKINSAGINEIRTIKICRLLEGLRRKYL